MNQTSRGKNFEPVAEQFKTAKPVIGRMYHIRGMYKGTFFRLLEFGENYAVLGYPNRQSKRLYACRLSDLKEIRKRSPNADQ